MPKIAGRVRLTKREVERARTNGRDTFVWDAEVPGLGPTPCSAGIRSRDGTGMRAAKGIEREGIPLPVDRVPQQRRVGRGRSLHRSICRPRPASPIPANR